MTPSLPLINEVIEGDLCIACGGCIHACPKVNIMPAFNSRRGAQEVGIKSTEQCSECIRPCDNVCPSIKVDFLKNKKALHQYERSEEQPNRDGWMKSVHVGWSPNYRDDGVSSSGGVIRAFIAYALDNNTPVICLALDPQDNQLKPRLLTGPTDIEFIPGSIYHSTSFVGAIDLIRDAARPVLLVAIPCQLSGLLQYIANYEIELGSKIKLVVGLVCGWMYSHHSLQAFSQFKKISDPLIDKTTYRGGDRVGQLSISTEKRRYFFERRNHHKIKELIDYQSCFSTDFNRLRCRICEDHLNVTADVIAGDAWLKRITTQKVSIIGCRTARGEDAVSNLVRLELLKLGHSSFDDLIESQSENLVFGHHARKMSQILKSKGLVTPIFSFRDSGSRISVTFKDKCCVKAELMRRSLIRRGYYSSYRILYIVRRMRIFIRCAAGFLKRNLLKL